MLLDAFVQEYRSLIPVRLATVAVITAIIGVFLSPLVAGFYCLCGCIVYGVLYRSLQQAKRDPSPAQGLRRLRLASGLTMGTMSLAVSLVSLYIRFLTPYNIEAALLLIGMLVYGALQPHMSRASFVACVISPMAALTIIAVYASQRGRDPVLLFAVAAFILGVAAMTMRHSLSNRRLIYLRARISDKNARLKAALRNARRHQLEAETASQAKSNFLAVTSHEIRTPLNAVLGLGEGLRREASTPRERELAEGVVEAGAMLLRLLNAVLDLSQIEQGRMQLRPSPVDVRQALRAIAALWSSRIEERGLAFELAFDGDPEGFQVMIDLGKLEQTVINLVSNAVKFTNEGDVRILAHALVVDGRSHLRIEVQDRGPGLAEADRERVFAPFEQTDFGRRAGGAGLGLAIAKALVQMMGGSIGAAPRPGGGSIFWLELDLPAAEVVESLAAPSQQSAVTGLRILAAEDNAANREVLKVLLRPASARLAIVENGFEAVEAAAHQDFDLILMDAHMPVMDGVEALGLIRAGERVVGHRRLIYMFTANVFDDDVQRYLAAGADGVLKKPIDLAELHLCLAHAERAAAAQAEAAPDRLRAEL